ncbi:MAG: hypothetical protein KKE29_16540 [Proteobacteria bacterium]|nr:hypothetical protein [Pseudomonadota bacterium]MBU4574540.1 hypothetical protein [Pseudomonadota bacterium]MBU4599639.1 hypothetical protein [Pseudomonadota bacterium]MBV1716135.1 hypothetical protein [Desulfarculus sp.]MBV1750884.1 hypothetical protein [Desulfarculus sp.]
MDAERGKKKRTWALVWAGAGIALGLYALVAWSLVDYTGGWQMGVAALILLAAPPLLWWVLKRN